MLRSFGRCIWRQSRDISVMNYPNHLVYEIYTNQGYFYVAQDKKTEKIEVVNLQTMNLEGYKLNEAKNTCLPNLE
jgi:hypothetical protein